MTTADFLPSLPAPGTITDKTTASDALSSTLAVVATTNRELAVAAKADSLESPAQDTAALHEHLKGLFKDLHELLPRIASFRHDIAGWSVTVGSSNTLTMNFINKHADS